MKIQGSLWMEPKLQQTKQKQEILICINLDTHQNPTKGGVSFFVKIDSFPPSCYWLVFKIALKITMYFWLFWIQMYPEFQIFIWKMNIIIIIIIRVSHLYYNFSAILLIIFEKTTFLLINPFFIIFLFIISLFSNIISKLMLIKSGFFILNSKINIQ